ncbi:MAG: response regulator [Gammaproteobacteria bacterium]|nr:response regulator [Gammaproteobacteria bacterium]
MNQFDPNPRNPPAAIVADDLPLRSSIRMLLTVAGMEVREYRTAGEYLASRFRPHHCVIVDCPLAGIPDHRLCRALVRRRHPVPVVLLTDFPDIFHFAAIDRSDIRILHKPFQGDLLIATIKALTGAVPEDGSGPRAQRHPRRSAH